MQITPTIQAEIQNYLREHKLNMSQFATLAGLNAGTVSGMVMSNRAMSVHQLDCVTRALGKPEDYFYSRYVQEYIVDASVDWRRVKAFLQRCTELNRLDCIAQVVSVLMDNVTYYAPLTFELAEELFALEQHKAAELLYENLAISERQQHSERLAVCQYRLFKIRTSDDHQKNYDIAVQFEPYIDRLDELMQLDALRELINTYRSLRKWSKMRKFAEILESKAEVFHRLGYRDSAKDSEVEKSLYPPFVYWAFAHLIQAEVCDANKDYESAFQHIQRYADLSWVEGEDEVTLKWKTQFKEWSIANTYVNRLMSGDASVIPEYITYFSAQKEETLSVIDNIIKAANRYNLNVDDVLEKFKAEIQFFLNEQIKIGVYTQQIITERFTHLTSELAKYYMDKGMYEEGFTFLLECLGKSASINNESYINKGVRYEYYQKYTSPENKAAYRQFINVADET
ncbi:hypothetical protein [Paenibacillus massiliensis]|uniref:hypothetical protein n=1 Tax=Paenibacillus massiliensis TaxID=225917 RepID=UPI0003753288|nr:hypothetical protein [Paenibacillus massiliensis]